jgi:hypothetical protein
MAEGACAVLTGQCLARRLPQSAALVKKALPGKRHAITAKQRSTGA